MKNTFLKQKNRAFILPLTLLITTIILAVSTGITTILIKQMFFSRLARESTIAFYAADSGLACAQSIDDTYINQSTGLGIFQYDNDLLHIPQASLDSYNELRTSRGIPIIPTLANIRCGGMTFIGQASPIYEVTDYGSPVVGKTTTFNLTMDLGDGTYRCAQVIINKTPTFRQIISRGFSTCNVGASNFLERAVVNTTSI